MGWPPGSRKYCDDSRSTQLYIHGAHNVPRYYPAHPFSNWCARVCVCQNIYKCICNYIRLYIHLQHWVITLWNKEVFFTSKILTLTISTHAKLRSVGRLDQATKRKWFEKHLQKIRMLHVAIETQSTSNNTPIRTNSTQWIETVSQMLPWFLSW